jgi:hypothetical protein
VNATLARVWRVFLTVMVSGMVLAALAACGGSAPVRSEGPSGGAAQPGGSGAAATAAPALTGAAGGAARPAAGNAAQDATQNINVPDIPRQVIKNGNLGLVVKDVDSAVAQAGGIALRHGGDVTQSSIGKRDDARVADLVLQVESGRFDAAMAELRQMDGVIERTTDKSDSKDVTEEYVDVKAQITNLEATERQLRALLDKATRIEDILAIQREITGVRGQIDRLQGRANYLERRSAMSTITLHLASAAGATPRTPDGWRFADVVARAWAASLTVLQGLVTALVSVAVFSWWLLPVLALGWLALRRYRRRVARRPAAPASTAPTGD